MSNVNITGSNFLSTCTVKSPIKLTGITQGVRFNNKDPTMLFNSNTGSRTTNKLNMTFKYESKKSTKTQDLKRIKQKSCIDAVGNLKWVEKTRSVLRNEERYIKKLHHCFLEDENGSSIKLRHEERYIKQLHHCLLADEDGSSIKLSERGM